jgi:hypothetical protein
MGGSGAPSAPQVSQPSIAPELAAMSLQAQATRDALNNRAQMLKVASQITPLQAFPDVWGQAGAYNIAKDTAYLNAANSQELKKALDPQGYKIEQNTKNTIADLTDPLNLKALANQQFAQRTLPSMYGTGLNTGSQAFGGELFKKGTLDYTQLMQQLAGIGNQYTQQNPSPQVGLNPGSVASVPAQAQAQAAAQGNAFIQGMLGQGASLQNSVDQGYGNLFSNIGNLTYSNMANQLATNQANQNAQAQATGSLYGGLGALGGGILGSFGGPAGTAVGSSLGGLGGSFIR